MNILIAPDKFKGTLDAKEVCHAIADGLQARYPDAHIIQVPMADGGEGTCELLTEYFNGRTVEVEVTGPSFEKISSGYGLSADGRTAFIEMARASGLQLVQPGARNPLFTTTLGTGELIRHAIDQGVSNILMGIGGSATNDAGMGMLQALGVQFLDEHKAPLKPIGANLEKVQFIVTNLHPRLKEVTFTAICDVDNPLHGPRGAAYTYAPQKGASEEAVGQLDRGLRHFEKIVTAATGISIDFPGSGAGGGLPGGARAFFNISFQRGMDYIIRATGLETKAQQADVIITGEGKIDQQTLAGKVVMEVGKLGMKHGKRVVAVAGKCELPPSELRKVGISEVIDLTAHFSPQQAMEQAFELIRKLVGAKIRLP